MSVDDELSYMAERMHHTRPSSTVDEYLTMLRNPIASRLLGVYVEIDIPALGRSMVFDTRVDNPSGLAPSLSEPGLEDAWPSAAIAGDGPRPEGHSGSSCPRIAGLGVLGEGDRIEIPVEILAFHAEGHNGEVAYSVTMYSEVTGRLVLPLDPDQPAHITMWGRMQITVLPDDPSQFGGIERMEFVSRDYIKQEGRMHGFPPRDPGAYLESSGNEVYVSADPRLADVEVIVRRGRIIFSTDVDDFLQARTRVTRFELLDHEGNLLVADDPYDSSLIGQIGGVRLAWREASDASGRTRHYNLYRIDPDNPVDAELLAPGLTETTFVDTDYDGTHSYAYSVVPAFADSTGTEVQGVSLDIAEVMSLVPHEHQLSHRNHGVGHLRRPPL